MSGNVFERLLAVLSEPEARKIAYSLSHARPEAPLVSLAVPGERWEVEFLDDGSVDVERFRGTGALGGEEELDELFASSAD